MAFTLSQSRLFDLPKRPQWIGCWDKVNTSGYVYMGASPSWEPVCFYNLPPRKHGPRWADIFRHHAGGFLFQQRDYSRKDAHPCPKSVALYKQLLAILPDGVVVDPCMGTGVTLRAAKDIGRTAIGIDISERYCELAAERLRQGTLLLGV